VAEQAIKMCDKGDKNGMLNKPEVIACGVPKNMADELFGMYGPDKNGDGELSKAEIEAFVKKMME